MVFPIGTAGVEFVGSVGVETIGEVGTVGSDTRGGGSSEGVTTIGGVGSAGVEMAGGGGEVEVPHSKKFMTSSSQSLQKNSAQFSRPVVGESKRLCAKIQLVHGTKDCPVQDLSI